MKGVWRLLLYTAIFGDILSYRCYSAPKREGFPDVRDDINGFLVDDSDKFDENDIDYLGFLLLEATRIEEPTEVEVNDDDFSFGMAEGRQRHNISIHVDNQAINETALLLFSKEIRFTIEKKVLSNFLEEVSLINFRSHQVEDMKTSLATSFDKLDQFLEKKTVVSFRSRQGTDLLSDDRILSRNRLLQAGQSLVSFVWNNPLDFVRLLFVGTSALQKAQKAQRESLYRSDVDKLTYGALRSVFRVLLKAFGNSKDLRTMIMKVSYKLTKARQPWKLTLNLEETLDWLGFKSLPEPINKYYPAPSFESKVNRYLYKLLRSIADEDIFATPSDRLVTVMNYVKYLVLQVLLFFQSFETTISTPEREINYNKIEIPVPFSSTNHNDQLYSAGESFKFRRNISANDNSNNVTTNAAENDTLRTMLSNGTEIKITRSAAAGAVHDDGIFVVLNSLLSTEKDIDKNQVKWKILRQAFHNRSASASYKTFYNYFVDENMISNKLDVFEKALSEKMAGIQETDTSLVAIKNSINGLKILLSDTVGVRREALESDIEGYRDLGEVLYTAEMLVNELALIVKSLKTKPSDFEVLDQESIAELLKVFA